MILYILMVGSLYFYFEFNILDVVNILEKLVSLKHDNNGSSTYRIRLRPRLERWKVRWPRCRQERRNWQASQLINK